jgi:hypothetical protein
MEIDWSSIATGIATGLVAGYAIYKYSTWKGKSEENRAKFHGYNTEKNLLTQKYPDYFSNPKAKRIEFNEIPQNDDTPYLSEIVFNEHPLQPGKKHKALLRVSDEKWNFPMASGIKATLLGQPVTISNEDFGFMLLEFEIPKYAKGAKYSIECELRDVVGNSNKQSIELNLV